MPAPMATSESINTIPSLVVLEKLKWIYGEAATWYISRKTYVRSWKSKFTFCKEPRRQSSQTNDHWLPTKVIVLEVQILTFKKEFDNVKERLTDVEGSHDDLYRYTQNFFSGDTENPQRKEDIVDNSIKSEKLLEVKSTCCDIILFTGWKQKTRVHFS